MNATKLTASERIAAFAHAFDTSALSESHWRACSRSLADTLAVAIAGTGEHASQCALRYLDRSVAVRCSRNGSVTRCRNRKVDNP